MELLDHITHNPKQCGGKPCIRGMRIRVVDVLELLADGMTADQIVKQLPDLEVEDVKASLLFAARQANEPGRGMNFWLDAQLDPELAPWMGSTFKVVVKPVSEAGLRDAEDHELFEAARRIGDIGIITKDEDFAALVRRLNAPPKILWLRCGNMRTVRLQSVLSQSLREAFKLMGGECRLVQVERDGTCTFEI